MVYTSAQLTIQAVTNLFLFGDIKATSARDLLSDSNIRPDFSSSSTKPFRVDIDVDALLIKTN
jgi:hypothetical protein